MYRQSDKPRKQRKCIVCGTEYFHHVLRKCVKCRIKKPKLPRSWEDGLSVLKATKNIRDELIMHFQLFQGLREGEILGSDTEEHGSLKPLTLSQIDLVNKKILIHGKGGTIAYVFLDDEGIKLINSYLKFKRIGKDRPLINLSCSQYRRIVKICAVKAGLENPEMFHAHVLRAISITRMIRKKGLSFAKRHARHTSIKTTIMYDVTSTEESREDFNAVFQDN